MRRLIAVYISAFLVTATVLTGVPTHGQNGQPQEAFFVFACSPNPETFIFKLTDPQRIQEAREILANGSPKFVSGTIIKQPAYYNSPWSYHLDPKSISFADFAVEVCDASIRYIEDNRDAAYPAWCPWQSRLIKEIPPPAKPGTANLDPAISMTFPYADNTFGSEALANVNLMANADDADGAISKVEFTSVGKIIGEATSYPYSVSWRNLTAGTYQVLAIATDNNGARTVSKSVTFQISPGRPQLIIDPTTARGIVLESATLMSEPFSVSAEHFFSLDQRTRLTLFGHNLELKPEDPLSLITVQAEDSQNRTYVLPVEALVTVPDFPWLNQLTVSLPDGLQGLGDVWLSASLRGITSNKVRVKIK